MAAQARLLAASHALAFPPGEAWDEVALAALLGMPGCFACVDAAGAFVLARVAGDEAEVLTLAVPPLLRRAGRGRALLAQAVQRAAKGGARAIFLEVSRGNGPALALYAAAGFRQVGVRPRYYADGKDALVLRKEISPAGEAGA